MKKDLRDLTPQGVVEFVESIGAPQFRARQILNWLYRPGVDSMDGMKNIPGDLRQKLAEEFDLNTPEVLEQVADQFGCEKFLFKLADENLIESVVIPMKGGRFTLCISSQVGCRLGCKFCRTGYGGFIRNLTPAEIIGQVRVIKARPKYTERLYNVVFMGMGEPLDNFDNLVLALEIMTDENCMDFSHRKITVSTCGLIPGIEKLSEASPVNLAVSLNGSDDETRSELMPVNKRYPLSELFPALARYRLPPRKRITLEYVMIAGVTDRDRDILNLSRWIGSTPGLKVKFNLIRFNGSPEFDFKPSSPERILAFQRGLQDRGISVFIRESAGSEIAAACGQLAGERRKNNN